MIRYNAYRGAPQPKYLAKPVPKPEPEPVSRFRFWTPEDDAKLRAGLDKGWSYTRIGRSVGRSKSAVSSRVAKLRERA